MKGNINHGSNTIGKTQHSVRQAGKTGGTCGTCIHFPVCSMPGAKGTTPETDYCLWGTKSGLYKQSTKDG